MNVVTDREISAAEQRRVLAICCLSLVLVVLAVSSLNVALPALQRGLRPSATQLLWIVDAYALVFAGALLPAGALGDRFGRKGALMVGLTVFGVGALLAGFATSAAALVATRAVMGVGAGFVMPATLSIITDVFPVENRPRAMAVWAGFAGFGGAVGPLVSGLVLEVWDWNAVFFITVPVSGVTLLLVATQVPRSRDAAPSRFDPVGAGLSVLALFALLFAIIEGPEQGWTAGAVVAALVVAAVAAAAFVRWELAVDQPMLDPRVFRVRQFSVGATTITLLFFAMFGMFFLVAQFLQFAQGYSALDASVRMLPSGITLILVAPRSPAVVARLGRNRTVAAGLTAGSAGLLLLSLVGPGTPYVWTASALVLMAAGSGLAMPPSTRAIVESLPPGKAGVGSAVNDVTREVGGALGIAVLGSVVSAIYRADMAGVAASLPAGVRHAVEDSMAGASRAAADGGPGAQVLAPARDAFMSGTGTAFRVAALLLALGAVLTLVVERRDRAQARATSVCCSAYGTSATSEDLAAADRVAGDARVPL